MLLYWLRTLREQYRTAIVARLRMFVVIAALYSAAVALIPKIAEPDIPSGFHALLGTVLGLFLVFRTNTAYERWWEGRKLWGQLVNDSRNLASKVRAFVQLDRQEMHLFGRLLVNFAFALKEHLREGVNRKQLTVFRSMDFEPKHIPAQGATFLIEKVRAWRERGLIDGFDAIQLDVHVRAFMDICGACERIRKTPLPRSYRMFIRQCIALYLLSLPWGLVSDFNYWTIPGTAILAYFMIGIELIAEDVEEPFGRDGDDLMLDEICHTIEASVTEILETGPKSMQKTV